VGRSSTRTQAQYRVTLSYYYRFASSAVRQPFWKANKQRNCGPAYG